MSGEVAQPQARRGASWRDQKSIESSPASMHNSQPWLVIADITKEQIRENKNLVKGAKLEVIGGLHRRAAYIKVNNLQRQK